MNQLTKVNLKEVFAKVLEKNLGLHLTWQWDEELFDGIDYELYYVEIVKNEASAETLKQFLQSWMPIYEQLSMQHDYLVLRYEVTTKDSYNMTVQLEELFKDVYTPKLELWMDSIQRSQIINGLDEVIFDETKISKKHLYYLATSILSTRELYSLIEKEITQSELSIHSYFDQTQLQAFQTIHRAIAQYQAKQEIEVLYSLIDKLEDFYIWLKGVFTAVNYVLKKNDKTSS